MFKEDLLKVIGEAAKDADPSYQSSNWPTTPQVHPLSKESQNRTHGARIQAIAFPAFPLCGQDFHLCPVLNLTGTYDFR